MLLEITPPNSNRIPDGTEEPRRNQFLLGRAFHASPAGGDDD